ncbi:methylmalonyl-CoA mutase [Flavobacterium sp. xlx-214]|uniref:methylmalonyl-CoA mutase subunit beta n=1 Tax=unclassified Flavobacterium TaxID=196869 RepID=UPI0013D1223D|nr:MULTISPECIES: methylmalonyl-CoA mutase subunit beta [unclassified Flavobacterium]MBA5791227.1 methylmalonyl-CoA mutase [Flavobacterium sp. xlx-221]QMI83606.1 methylmalonyl-CoA mutase [Flavobacterium sp. xlx-214]
MLFKDFEKITSKQWKNQIQFELKGADYNDTLVWESLEGIKVKPFYHNDEDAVTNAVTTTNTQFTIVQEIYVFDVEKSISKANEVLNRGAESIRFIIPTADIDAANIINSLLKSPKAVYLQLLFLDVDVISKINNEAAKQAFEVFVLVDPIHQLGFDGNFFKDGNSDFTLLNEINQKANNINWLTVKATTYQNAGANMIQQVAYTLAHTNEYLNRITNFDKNITVEVAVGGNYFFEIAKLRAIRLTLNALAQAYSSNISFHIIAKPTHRNKTIYDYNVNMLRTTTECMSAVLGGADAVENLAYDAVFHKTNEFGDRISRNQLLILKEESYFDKVNNPADGAYYIESLTNQLAEKGLELFKDIEKNGGLISQLIEGTIQRKISEAAAKEQALFNDGKEVLLGTNKYPNAQDKMVNDLELYPFVKQNPRKTLITPIIEKRLAEALEQERLEAEKNA